MKLRSFFYGLAATVLGLFLLGAIGFGWINAHSPLALLRGSSTTAPSAAMFVPKQAPVMVSLTVNPDRLADLRQVLARPGERRQAREELESLRQSLLASTELNYQQDIQPWLGDEVTWTITTPDIDRDPQNGTQPGYLLAIATRNPERSREFLQLFWQKRSATGSDLTFEQYKGVKLIYSKPQAVEPSVKQSKSSGKRSAKSQPSSSVESPLASVATAVAGDRFVLFANDPKVLRDAINNVQAEELNVNQSRAYQQALQSFDQRPVALALVNLPQLTGEKSTLASSGDAANTSYETLAIGLGLSRQGLIAETTLLGASGSDIPAATPALTKPVGALQHIPAHSSVVAAGTDLQKFWSQLASDTANNPAIANLLNQPIEAARKAWQLDLPQDVFSWVQGEYALSLLPQTDRDRPDGIFVVERTANAIAAINRLDELAQQQGLGVGPLTLENRQVSAWTQLNPDIDFSTKPTSQEPATAPLAAQVQGVHGTVGNYEIFATSVEAMQQALQASKKGLLNSDSFRKAIATLPKANNGYLYLDWANSKSLVEAQLPLLRLLELTGQPFFSHLRSLTITSLSSEPGVRRSETLLQLRDSNPA